MRPNQSFLLKTTKNVESTQQTLKDANVLSKNSNSFRIVGLNPSELKKRLPSLNGEDFSHFEEKSNFQKALGKLRGRRMVEKISRKHDDFSQTPEGHKMRSKFPIKRCLSYHNPEKVKAPLKRKSEMLFGENISITEDENEKISISFTKRRVSKKTTPLPVSANKNFNITITNINNNIMIPSGKSINVNIGPPLSSSNEDGSRENFQKNSMDNMNLLSPTLLLKGKNKKEYESGETRNSLKSLAGQKINERVSSLEILKKQSSIQLKSNSFVIKNNKISNENSPLKNETPKYDNANIQSQTRFPSGKDFAIEEFLKNSENHRVDFFYNNILIFFIITY